MLRVHGLLALFLLCFVACPAPSFGDDEETATTEQSKDAEDTPAKADSKPEDADDKPAKAETDPFAVPDGDVAELETFVKKVMKTRPTSIETFIKMFEAVVEASDRIRKSDSATDAQQVAAIQRQIQGLNQLSRFDRGKTKELDALMKTLESDERTAVQGILEAIKWSKEISGLASADLKSQKATIKKIDEKTNGTGFDRAAYSLYSTAARGIAKSESTEYAAELYEKIADMMSGSEDEELVKRAEKTRGSARRLRLPGNFMEITGTTVDGEQFDWDSYRGKVVLVDFWASWCGPCRAEIPNMKRNLEAYGDAGFAIVGVNLDKTPKACNAYVEKEGLEWENLFSQNEDERGWDQPLATYYGVNGIPTAILVDKEGKVVSLSARGNKLNALLKKYLGDPPKPKVEEPATKAEPEPTAKQS